MGALCPVWLNIQTMAVMYVQSKVVQNNFDSGVMNVNEYQTSQILVIHKMHKNYE